MHLCNLVSDILEPLAKILGCMCEFLSTEDLLNRVDVHNNDVTLGISRDHYGVEDPENLMIYN